MSTHENFLFQKLRTAAGQSWTNFLCHPFVRGLGSGTLPESCFRHYLIQDYMFLFQFSRAYALAAFKAENLDELRHATMAIDNIVNVEMALHIEYCSGWGIDVKSMSTELEDLANIAYTRFVLDCGQKGDLLDLMTALAPCVIGYAEIGRTLSDDPTTKRDHNPYLSWIEMYASDEYQDVSKSAVAELEALATRRGGEIRFNSLSKIFNNATQLETAFWDMGWKQRKT